MVIGYMMGFSTGDFSAQHLQENLLIEARTWRERNRQNAEDSKLDHEMAWFDKDLYYGVYILFTKPSAARLAAIAAVDHHI